MFSRTVAAISFLGLFTASAQATTVCAWMVESNQPEQVRDVDIWLQADHDISFLYQVGGKGIITDTGHMSSPGSGTYSLKAGKAERPWGFGATLDSAGKIDVSMDLHKMPAQVTSSAPTPVLGHFVFQRDVPATETKPPATLAKKQCSIITTM
jgi:hypothetical protein